MFLVILNKQIVMVCNRQFCVDCQWCFIAEGTDCYFILYILTVIVYKLVYHNTSSQLDTARMHMCMQMLLFKNYLFSNCHIILRAWKTPTDTLPTVFSYREVSVKMYNQSAFIHWSVSE